jgi:hypothetical protein
MIRAFFKSTLEITLSEEKNKEKIRQQLKYIENYKALRDLALDVAQHVSRK